MDRTLTNFIRALRSSEVQVSPSEAIDAARTLQVVGYADRELMKDSLACVLAKSSDEKSTHDRLFDLYFARAETSAGNEDDKAAEGEGSDDRNDLFDLMENGDAAEIEMALEAAASEAGLEEMEYSTQVNYFAQQMVKAMGGEKMQQRLLDALRGGEEGDPELADKMLEARKRAGELARERARQAFEVFGRGATEQFRDDYAANRKLGALDRHDMERMKILIAKIAKRLATKHSRRRRKKNRGMLDVRRTMRANAGFDGVPFNVSWKQKKRDRPKIVAICDVSGSVAQYVRFLLLLLYSLHDAVPNLQAFAFSYRLEEVGDWFDELGFEPAMEKIINEVGMGSTDYGMALSDFKMKHWNAIDKRTTVIVLGDGRSNYGDPRMDIWKELTARSKRTLWLCPEPESMWGTGDSVMPRYKPYASQMSHVSTLKDLERAVDEVLSAYA